MRQKGGEYSSVVKSLCSVCKVLGLIPNPIIPPSKKKKTNMCEESGRRVALDGKRLQDESSLLTLSKS
jgi:hypothetical protein